MKSTTTRGFLLILGFGYHILQGSSWFREVYSFPSVDSRYLGLYVVLSSVVSQVTYKLGRFEFVSKLSILPSSGSELLQLVSTIVCSQILSRFVVFVFNVNFLVLFRTTEFTVHLVSGLARVSPLILIGISPFIKKASWYYLVGYCTVCGGAVLLSGVWSMLLMGLVWRKLVVSKWTVHSLL